MKGSTTTHYTRQNLPKSRTDWDKVKSLSDKEIEKSARNDPDNPIWTKDMLNSAQLMMPQRKVNVHMYLDQEIVDWFKADGKGYQSRINAVLKSYIHKKHV